MIVASLVLILALAWALRGVEQGVLWSRRGADAFEWNEHAIFVASRGAFIAYGIVCSLGNWIEALSASVVGIFMFPFFHEGAYYASRKRIDGTYDGWFAQPSSLSTADTNFPAEQRAWLFGIGVALYATAIVLNIKFN